MKKQNTAMDFEMPGDQSISWRRYLVMRVIATFVFKLLILFLLSQLFFGDDHRQDVSDEQIHQALYPQEPEHD